MSFSPFGLYKVCISSLMIMDAFFNYDIMDASILNEINLFNVFLDGIESCSFFVLAQNLSTGSISISLEY